MCDSKVDPLVMAEQTVHVFVDLVLAASSNDVDSRVGWVEYAIEYGHCIAFNIFRRADDSVAVQNTMITQGGTFPTHVHDVGETGIVYKGVCEVTDGGGQTRVLVPGDGYVVPPGEHHSITAIEDVWLIIAKVPAERGLPGGRGNPEPRPC